MEHMYGMIAITQFIVSNVVLKTWLVTILLIY